MNCKLILSATEVYKLLVIPSTLRELIQAIQTKMNTQTPYPFRLKYKDGEDELITLDSDEDLQTAVLTCKLENLKSLKVYVLKNEGNQALMSQTNSSLNVSQKTDSEASRKIEEKTPRGYDIVEQTPTPQNFSNLVEAAIKTCCDALQRGQTQRYSIQTRKGSDDNQAFDLEDVLNKTDILCRSNFRNSEAPRKKSGSPNEKAPSYKVQYKSRLEYDTIKVTSGETYNYSFTLRNCGEEQWPEKVQLICVNGIHKGQTKSIPSLKPKEQTEMGLVLMAPQETGKQLSQWRLHYDEKGAMKGFGRTFFIEINNLSRQSNTQKDNKRTPEKQINNQVTPGCGTSEVSRRAIEMGETLNDMFPGDLRGKVRFVESCPANYSIYDLVDNYLLTLRS